MRNADVAATPPAPVSPASVPQDAQRIAPPSPSPSASRRITPAGLNRTTTGGLAPDHVTASREYLYFPMALLRAAGAEGCGYVTIDMNGGGLSITAMFYAEAAPDRWRLNASHSHGVLPKRPNTSLHSIAVMDALGITHEDRCFYGASVLAPRHVKVYIRDILGKCSSHRPANVREAKG